MDSQKFQYFMDRTEKDLVHIREKVDKLWDFRSLLIGGSFVVSVISSAIVSIILFFLERH